MKYFQIFYSWYYKYGDFKQCHTGYAYVMGETEEAAIRALKPEENQIFTRINDIEEMTKQDYNTRIKEIEAGKLRVEKMARLSKILVENNKNE